MLEACTTVHEHLSGYTIVTCPFLSPGNVQTPRHVKEQCPAVSVIWLTLPRKRPSTKLCLGVGRSLVFCLAELPAKPEPAGAQQLCSAGCTAAEEKIDIDSLSHDTGLARHNKHVHTMQTDRCRFASSPHAEPYRCASRTSRQHG